MILIE